MSNLKTILEELWGQALDASKIHEEYDDIDKGDKAYMKYRKNALTSSAAKIEGMMKKELEDCLIYDEPESKYKKIIGVKSDDYIEEKIANLGGKTE